jgi:hypothetical protein
MSKDTCKVVGPANAALILGSVGTPRRPRSEPDPETLPLWEQQERAREREVHDPGLLASLRGRVLAGMIGGLAVDSVGERL